MARLLASVDDLRAVQGVGAEPATTEQTDRVAMLLDYVKQYVRIQGTASDVLLYDLMADALATIEGHLGRPIFATQVQMQGHPQLVGGPYATTLLIPVTPVDFSGTPPTITDADDVTVDELTYTVGDPWTGAVRAGDTSAFDNGPYSVLATVGLEVSADPSYAGRIEPALFASVRDIVADDYQRRNPNASNETEGGGVSRSYSAYELPERVCKRLAPYRKVRAAL